MLVENEYPSKVSDNQKLIQMQGRSLELHGILFQVLKK